MPDSLKQIIVKMLEYEKAAQPFYDSAFQLLHQKPIFIELQSVFSSTELPELQQNTMSSAFSEKPDVNTQPICAYLCSAAKLDLGIPAYQWAITALFASAVLSRIGIISGTEHHKTIKILLDRFRLATEALIKSQHSKKLFKYEKEYLWLWSQLPKTELPLKDFEKHLLELENSGHLNTFQFNLIRDIRRAFNYVVSYSPKKAGHGNAAHKQLEYYALDESESMLAVQELPSSESSRALQYELLSDDPQSVSFQLETDKFSPLCINSKTAQHRAVKHMQQHILHLQHRFSSSSRYPDLESIHLLISHCWAQYKARPLKNKAYLIILMSFLTGNSAEEWLRFQSKNIVRLNNRQKIIYIDNRCFLRSKFTLFDPAHFAFEKYLLNQVTYFDLPLPDGFIASIKEKPMIGASEVRDALHECRTALHIPSLSSKKLTVLLHAVIYQMTGSAQLSDILTGTDANRSSSISYGSYPVYQLQREYLKLVEQLSADLGKTLHASSSTEKFGSRKSPNGGMVKQVFTYLYAQIIQSKLNNDDIAAYNHYSIWLWHILLLFTAARPVKDFPGLLQDFDLENGWLWVSDKEIHGRNDDGRLLPLCRFVRNELKAYLNYLRSINFIGCTVEDGPAHVQDILESKNPLLWVYTQDQWRPLSPSVVAHFTESMGLEHANWLRHTARAFLTGKTDETLILALFGHEKNQQEMGNAYSSLALNRYRALTDTLESMKDEFEINGMFGFD